MKRILTSPCRRRFSSIPSTTTRPEFDANPAVLDLNTGLNGNSSNRVQEMVNLCTDKQAYFVGRIPLIGICEDSNSSYMKGARSAPDLIRKAFLCSSGSFDQYYSEQQSFINTETAMIDCGNFQCDSDSHTNHENVRQLLQQIYDMNASVARTEGYFPRPLMILGGDHSITYPILSGIKQSEPFAIQSRMSGNGNGKIGVIQFDAHPDLYPPQVIDASNQYTHASPFYHLLEDSSIDQLLQIGLRCMTKAQYPILQKHQDRIQQVHMEQLFGVDEEGMRAIDYYQQIWQQTKQWLTKCEQAGITNFYISIDLDVLDPAVVPGIAHYEPGGLLTRELLCAVDIVMKQMYSNAHNLLIGCDVVEYNPSTDDNFMSAFVAARVMKRLVANDMYLSQSQEQQETCVTKD